MGSTTVWRRPIDRSRRYCWSNAKLSALAHSPKGPASSLSAGDAGAPKEFALLPGGGRYGPSAGSIPSAYGTELFPSGGHSTLAVQQRPKFIGLVAGLGSSPSLGPSLTESATRAILRARDIDRDLTFLPDLFPRDRRWSPGLPSLGHRAPSGAALPKFLSA